MSARLLIVEDDLALSRMLALHFEDQGFAVDTAADCAGALARLEASAVDLVLLDHQLPDGNGLELLRRMQAAEPELPVIMMTGRHDLELAIEAIKQGARDFVHKPLNTEELQNSVDRALESRRLAREVAALRPESLEAPASGALIGRSDAMLAVSKEIALSAESTANVLITGESGTGKEVVARLIHMHSGRTGPFVAVNCAAIVDTLLESELFGHEKGAFTGAAERRIGRLELARDGTLFLDEVGELAAGLQAKLLRALQERVFERVGGNQQIASNARLISATNRDLDEEVRAGRFREDLAYRLKVVGIHLPALRERPEDIPVLVPVLMERIGRALHRSPLQVTDPAMERLCAYAWPGNIRELENVLTQAMLHARGAALTPELLGLPEAGPGRSAPASGAEAALRTLNEVEAEHVQRVLDHTAGHKGRACTILGISRPALDRKIRKYALRLHRGG
jgi:two-component system response regulator AtoC